MISVVIPSYNREKVIKRSIISVLNQTYKDIEVIIVDDNSSDNTEKIVKSINDGRVKYIKFEKNRGACAARNYGVEIAKGKYIAFQDSDDEWENDKLEKQIKFLENNNLDVVYCKLKLINKTSESIFPNESSAFNKSIYYQNRISTQAILAKRSCLIKEKFDENLLRFQDWELAIRLCEKYKVEMLDEALAIVYRQDDSISANPKKAIQSLEIMINKHGKNKKIRAHYLRLIGVYKLQAGTEDYRKLFWQSFNLNPLDKKVIFDIFVGKIIGEKKHYDMYLKRGRFS